ncbi:MAG TPA: hypothetical protein VLV28_01690 [Gaiellaceae bacterium]|nr:hypothetical protein [Gaiellaceae bacterium]
MKRYVRPLVVATYAAKDLRKEAALVAVASSHQDWNWHWHYH